MTTTMRPLTLLKAYRIVHNLDPSKICEAAQISRSYLSRLEQGVTPSAEIAARIINVLTTRTNEIRVTEPALAPCTPYKDRALTCARELLEQTKARHQEFAQQGIAEIHLLYPQRYQAGVDHVHA